MGGRYGRRADKQRITEWMQTHNTNVFDETYLAPSYNVAPTDFQPIVRLDRDGTTVEGVAHVEPGAFGTYVVLDRPGAATPVAGYVAFGNEQGFPDLYQLNGQRVAIHGVVSMYGLPLIQMTTPEQLEVVG